MKTLVVLSALAVFVIAAPAPPTLEEGFEDISTSSSEEKNPELREKKSTSHDFAFTDGDFDTIPSNSQNSAFSSSASGRTLAVKKPIIVKKKVGYHLYRNSDEEQEHTSSRENCMERVKVKLCNEKMMPKSIMRSSMQEDTNMSEDEMKHSITMAKEAVEILQRDLKRLEDKAGVNLLQDRESDAEFHEDIEIARQALEHVQKNFGNLESMTLHSSTTKDADTSPDTPQTAAKTEEERLAQWKEAMDNIQKNMDIARNIEDSFRFSNNMLINENDMNSGSNNEDLEDNLNSSHFSSMEQEMRMSLRTDAQNEESNTSENLVRKSQENMDGDNEGSASTLTELKADNVKTADCMKSGNDNIESNQNTLKEKSSDVDLTTPDGLRQGQFVSMPKDIEKTEQTGLNKNKLFKVSDNIMDSDVGASTNQMTFVKSDLEKSKNMQDEIQHDKNGKVSTSMKSKNALPSNEHKEQTMKTDDQNNQFTENAQRSQILMFTNKADSTGNLQKFSNERKSIPAEGNLASEVAKEAIDMRWTHNIPLHSGESSKEFFDQSRDTQFSSNPQTFVQFMQPGINMDTAGQMLPIQGSRMSNFLMRAQTNERDWEMQPSQQMNMRENTGMKPDRLFRWKPTHESSRSGFPIASASTGIYPNTNGCSIPLLVSCAPSVVTGSMSKGHHPGYAAPAYRTDEDKGFPIKRETKNGNEIIVNAETDTATNVKQKTTKTVEKQ